MEVMAVAQGDACGFVMYPVFAQHPANAVVRRCAVVSKMCSNPADHVGGKREVAFSLLKPVLRGQRFFAQQLSLITDAHICRKRWL